MTDQDARELKRLIILYGSQPVISRLNEIVRSFASQSPKWGPDYYRMRAAMKSYNHPSKIARTLVTE